MFHIFTHAFFKCCLFLCAGSVSPLRLAPLLRHEEGHGRAAQEDADHVRRVDRLDAGALPACSRSSPASSRRTRSSTTSAHNGYTVFSVVGLVGAFMTAAYMTRATYLTFFGEPRGAAGRPRRRPRRRARDGAHRRRRPRAASLSAAANAEHGGEGSASDEPHGARRTTARTTITATTTTTPARTSRGKLILVPIVILAVLAVAGRLPQPDAVRLAIRRGRRAPDDVRRAPADAVVTEEFLASGPANRSSWSTASPQCGRRCRGRRRGRREVGLRLRARPRPARLLLPERQPRRAEVRQDPAVARHRRARRHASAIASATWPSTAARQARSSASPSATRLLRGGYLFLENKYYLDALYENVIVQAVAHPIAKAAYWINQNVIDGIVNGVGIGTRKTGQWVYDNIDQRVVDGAVNGSGWAASRGRSAPAAHPVRQGQPVRRAAVRRRHGRRHRPRPRQRS